MARRTRSPLRIAVTSYKGGTGKTTVAANLAGALAAAGRRVLVVDADQQGGAGFALGVEVGKPTLHEVLAGDAKAAEAVRTSQDVAGLDVLVADPDLSSDELTLPQHADWQLHVRRVVDQLLEDEPYDVVLVDTPPGVQVVSFAALMAADRVLVVTVPAVLDYRGLTLALAQAGRAERPVLGVVPNRVGRRTRHQDEALTAVSKAAGRQLLSPLPERTVVREAQTAGQPLSVFAPRSGAAAAFDVLAQEVLTRARS